MGIHSKLELNIHSFDAWNGDVFTIVYSEYLLVCVLSKISLREI